MMRTAYGGGRLGGGERKGRSSFSSDGSHTPDWLPPPSAPTRAPRSGEGGEPPEGSVFSRLYSDAKNRADREEKDLMARRSPGRSPRSPGRSPRSPWGGGSLNSSRSSMSSRTSMSSSRTNQSGTGGIKVRSKKQAFAPSIRGVLKSGGEAPSRADLPPDAKVHFGDFSMVQYPKDEELQQRYTVFWDAIQAKMKEAYRQQNRVKQGLAKQQAEKAQDTGSRRSLSPSSNLEEDSPYDELAKDVMMTVRTMPLEEEQTLTLEEEGRLMAVPLAAKSAEWWRIWNEEFDKEEDRLVAPRVWDYVFEKGNPKSSL